MSEAADAAALAHLLDQEDDLDSEDLDRLEDEAEKELLADIKQEGLEAPSSLSGSDDTDYVFGPMSQEDVQCIIADLRAHGLMECLQRHILPTPSKMIFTRILRQRQKLPQYNTVTDVLDLLRRSKRIVVLCGAGISVSCGIPDFRSKDGLYAILAKENQYELDDPSDMFDKDTFLRDPSMFYSFAHSIYPAHFEPSPSHHFVRKLEMQGKLLRMYSQNIDTLEQKAGIQRVVQCHGSFATATCTDPRCGYHTDGESIRADILAKRVPTCPRCDERRERERAHAKRRKVASDEEEDDDGLAYGIMKPDITFFGEKLPDAFEQSRFDFGDGYLPQSRACGRPLDASTANGANGADQSHTHHAYGYGCHAIGRF
ncbi:NAD-dependent histone deacetylase sir2 [Malassezia nana]|uniref:NAD-dependent histone deacetylase sir2 n=1 Tax=Malassezia nana TaxID=180528 RepID=A0AAF0ELP8_9BASI|nr:NAD-dependent histone deacetylase sir2 [Malassezia nana]